MIAGSGGALTKTGTGILTLSGINTYSGATTVSEGKLIGVTGASCASSAVSISSANGVTVTDNTKVWTCGGLAYPAAGVLDFDFGSTVPSTSTAYAPIQVSGNVSFTATPTVTIEATAIPAGLGNYPLITWTGSGPAEGPVTTTLSLPPRVLGSLSISGTTLYLNITGNTQPLTWNVGSSDWDINFTQSWRDSSGNTPIVYLEGDTVRFDDTTADAAGGTATYTVNIAEVVNPASVTVSNNVVTYSFAGFAISGTTALTKSGTGSLTLSAANAYTGITTIDGGTLAIGADTCLGSVPGSATPGAIVINGGTLWASLSGAVTLSATRGIAVGPSSGSGPGTIKVDSSTRALTYGGIIANNSSGTGSLTKSGAGTLVLSGASTYSGTTSVSAGKLVVNGSTAAGSGVTVAALAVLAGGGTVNGSVAVNGTNSPGTVTTAALNAIGTLNTGPEAWNGGGAYRIEITNATTTAGTGWDLLNISGALTVNATSGSKFIIKVASLTAAAAVGLAPVFVNTTDYKWRIATASGGVSGFDASYFFIDTAGFSNPQGTGHFIVTQSGNDVYLEFVHLTANPVTIGRAWGTYLRILKSEFLSANVSGGTPPRTLTGLTSRNGSDYVNYSGDYILFAPVGNTTSILDYTVTDSTSGTPYTGSSTITVTVTNAVSATRAIINSSGSTVTATFFGMPGFKYQVQRTLSLSPVSWVNYGAVQTADGTTGKLVITDTVANGSSAWYRLVQAPE